MSEERKAEPPRLSDGDFIKKWRSEMPGTKAWTGDHYARSMRAKPTQAEISAANNRAKRKKR
jgi:hypothetical protein